MKLRVTVPLQTRKVIYSQENDSKARVEKQILPVGRNWMDGQRALPFYGVFCMILV